MISPLPYANRIEYFINTKLQLEITEDLKHDISCALYDFAVHSEKVSESEKLYWRDLYFKNLKEN